MSTSATAAAESAEWQVLCDKLASEWVEDASRPPNVQDRSYDQCVWGELDSLVNETLLSALTLKEDKVSKRQGKRVGVQPRPDLRALPLPLPHLAYRGRPGRERLKRLITTLVKWNERISYQPPFALLAAHLLAVVSRERAAFKVAVAVFSRYRLQDYYRPFLELPEIPAPSSQRGRASGRGTDMMTVEVADRCLGKPTEAVMQDAACIWMEMQQLWPAVTGTFSKWGREDLFFALAQWWLRSLLAWGFDPNRQSFEDYLKLIHRIVMTKPGYDPEDPRKQLRDLVRCLFIRNAPKFQAANNGVDFAVCISLLKAQHIQVDDEFLELIDTQVPSSWSGSVQASLVLPFGVACGSMLGAAGVNVVGTTFSLAPLATVASGLVGAAVAGLLAASAVWYSGQSFFQTAMPGAPLSRSRSEMAQAPPASISSSKPGPTEGGK